MSWKSIRIPQIIILPALLWGLKSEVSYEYYKQIRWLCCPVFAYLAYQCFKKRISLWDWVWAIAFAIYMPLTNPTWEKEIWYYINLVTTIVIAVSIFLLGYIEKSDD